MSSARELESKFEVPDDARSLPDLSEIGMTIGAPVELDLDATYYDTADLRLLGEGVTLRNRGGGNDAGWHLKLPAADGARTEIHEPSSSAPTSAEDVPGSLRSLIRSRIRHAELAPVARLRTTRTERPILDAAGAQVATMADDRVVANRLPDGPVEQWREVEVELAPGAPDERLHEIADVLTDAGWQPGSSSSKLARVLPAPAAAQPTTRSAAERCLIDDLAAQVEAIVAADPLIREGDAEAVHAMRVATRRLRSSLATFRPLFDASRTEPVRDDLRDLGGVLGALRDDQVLLERLRGEVAELPPELVLGPVADRITREMNDRASAHHAQVIERLDSDAHLGLLDRLHALVADPPWRGGRPVTRKQLRQGVARAAHRVDRIAAALASSANALDDPRQHDLRKAAKRARYAAELVRPLFGKPAKRSAGRFEALQEELGEYQDSIGAQAVLRQLGAGVRDPSENGFTFGVLHEAERQRGHLAVERA
ncbi:MAG: domain containing protein, partial [Ilumatobacteraceae bacterium]|nr:domain containing protein [Ilumatobacteraceae bacterium]